MTATIKEQLCDSYHFPGSTNYWKDKYFPNIFVSRNDLKKYQLSQFLASQTHDEIWHLFKIFCNFHFSENFDISPARKVFSQGKFWKNLKKLATFI